MFQFCNLCHIRGNLWLRFPFIDLLWWLIVIVLFAVGLIGTVLPIFPGTTIILAAATIHRVMLGPMKSIGWWTIGILTFLTLVSYALDFVGGYFEARKFGATKWGTLGVLLGAIVGIVFGLTGLLIGPDNGAITGELLHGQR